MFISRLLDDLRDLDPLIRPELNLPTTTRLVPTKVTLQHLCRQRQHSPISGGNDSRKRHEKRLIFKIGTIHPHGLNERFSFI